MSNYPNMSYCMIENTTNALKQVVEALEGYDNYWPCLDLNQYERAHVDQLAELCKQYLKAHEDYDPDALVDNDELEDEDEE